MGNYSNSLKHSKVRNLHFQYYRIFLLALNISNQSKVSRIFTREELCFMFNLPDCSLFAFEVEFLKLIDFKIIPEKEEVNTYKAIFNKMMMKK